VISITVAPGTGIVDVRTPPRTVSSSEVLRFIREAVTGCRGRTTTRPSVVLGGALGRRSCRLASKLGGTGCGQRIPARHVLAAGLVTSIRGRILKSGHLRRINYYDSDRGPSSLAEKSSDRTARSSPHNKHTGCTTPLPRRRRHHGLELYFPFLIPGVSDALRGR